VPYAGERCFGALYKISKYSFMNSVWMGFFFVGMGWLFVGLLVGFIGIG